MKLLRDTDIISLVEGEKGIIEALPKPRDWNDKNSPIQPSSVDLHIGKIYLPGTKRDDTGGVEKPKDQHVLRTGHTAVVVTLEKLILPNNIAGIGFPPARVSSQGLLMTNPGHVDPGYEGPMHFTVINMGREHYVLTKGNEIVTMMLFELTDTVSKGWLERRDGKKASPLNQKILDGLCSDFMNVKRRAERISNKAVKRAMFLVKLVGAMAPIIIGVAVVLGNWIVPAWKTPLSNVQTRVTVLEERIDITNVKDRIKEIEQRQDKFEKEFQDISSAQGARPEE